MEYISLKDVTKQYKTGEVMVEALRGVSFSVDEGDFAVIVGPSGAGKTTLLNLIGGMEPVGGGVVSVAGKRVDKFSPRQLTAYRRNDIGFVFQFYNLVQNLTALENVELAAHICKSAESEKTLRDVGMGHRLASFPSQLSGGEQQRVAIARALAKNPKLLLCDEPTGALDYNTGKDVLRLLRNTCREKGMTAVVITHNQAITPMADKVIRIKNGTAESVLINENPVPIEEIEW